LLKAPGLRLMLEELRSGRLNEEAFVNHAYAKLGYQGHGVPARYRDADLLEEERIILGMVLGRELEKLPHPVRKSIQNRMAHADVLEPLIARDQPGSGGISEVPDTPAPTEVHPHQVPNAAFPECTGWLPAGVGGATTFDCVHQTPNFAVFYNVEGERSVNPDDSSAGAQPGWGDVPGNGVPNYIERMSRSLEWALRQYNALGYGRRSPDKKIAVLIGSRLVRPIDEGGSVPPPAVGGFNIIHLGSNYHGVDHKMADEFYLPRHELFHVMQYGYLQLAHVLNVNVVNTWMEATAEWGAHQALRHDTGIPYERRVAYADALGAFLREPGRTLLSWDGFGESRQYGAFIFAEFLHERFGVDSVRRTWEHLRDDNPDDALWETIAELGAQPREEIRLFHLANYQMCPTVSPPDYGTSFHYTDIDVTAWCDNLTGIGRRPVHRVMNLLADGKAASGLRRLGGGAADYVDLFVSGDPALLRTLQVTGKARFGSTSMTVVSWENIPKRCVPDRYVSLPAEDQESSLVTRIGGSCSMVTVMLSNGVLGLRPDDVQWETTFIGGAVGGPSLVDIGVQRGGNLIIPGERPSAGTQTTDLGLRFKPTNYEAVADVGCHCEGWGIQVTPPGGLGQWSGGSHGVSGLSPNAEVTRFEVTNTSVTSEVRLTGTSHPVYVTHEYRPSAQPELFDVEVTIEVLGPPEERPHITYRRIVDWDVEPTPLAEYVTVRADHPKVEFASDHGLSISADPALGRPVLFNQGSFTDAGPYDQGTLFDFFVPLEDPPGPETGNVGTFHLYYGAAPNQAAALRALADVGAPVYSLAKPSTAGNPAGGEPNTFILGYKPVT
jgi:hypothetical protein